MDPLPTTTALVAVVETNAAVVEPARSGDEAGTPLVVALVAARDLPPQSNDERTRCWPEGARCTQASLSPLPGQHHSQLLGLRAKTARSRVEVEIIDAELEMIWLADLGRALSATCIHCILISTRTKDI